MVPKLALKDINDLVIFYWQCWTNFKDQLAGQEGRASWKDPASSGLNSCCVLVRYIFDWVISWLGRET